ncbi:bifunctional hydroxymethylpyrimidine kinase/phosphomethylpyrimidine kinase [Nocardioides limicola]|uniref:bifunctional hydroxymethylpyrimidine kinase/phosphomethylpyrimidine kinase n=1 Tax=Nocardioides limicola TaxID=2803368 RepID=UPI001EF0DEE9|nr:bifunctional hydroxymethylpyrimidine kinase/phosphomethylpyrimidine kinase [Nocardioides sp. DJM-14]
MTPPVVLTIAGSDSGGAAGIAADLTTIAALGGHGACVVTAVTAQDTLGVHGIHPVPWEMVAAQLDAVLDDLPVAVVKTGMLGSAEVVALLADRLSGLPLVVDPVLVATSGAVLGDEAVRVAYRELLLPVATVVTPNLDEARALAQGDGTAQELATQLAALGPAVVVTGGPEWTSTDSDPDRESDRESAPESAQCTDWLALPPPSAAPQSEQPDIRGSRLLSGVATPDNSQQSLTSGSSAGRPVPVRHPAVPTRNDHGSGCTFSAALATRLAHGDDLTAAVRRAGAYTTSQLRLSASWQLGRGRGPIAHVSTRPPIEGDPA